MAVVKETLVCNSVKENIVTNGFQFQVTMKLFFMCWAFEKKIEKSFQNFYLRKRMAMRKKKCLFIKITFLQNGILMEENEEVEKEKSRSQSYKINLTLKKA